MFAPRPCTSTTGFGWAALGWQEKSFAPGGETSDTDVAAAAGAAHASAPSSTAMPTVNLRVTASLPVAVPRRRLGQAHRRVTRTMRGLMGAELAALDGVIAPAEETTIPVVDP